MQPVWALSKGSINPTSAFHFLPIAIFSFSFRFCRLEFILRVWICLEFYLIVIVHFLLFFCTNLIRCVRTVCCWMIAWVDVLCLPILEDVVSSLNGHWPMLKNHIERWKRSRKLCFLCTANECNINFELLNRLPVCVNAMIGHVHCINRIQMMRLFNYMLIMISFPCTLTQQRHTNMHSQ